MKKKCDPHLSSRTNKQTNLQTNIIVSAWLRTKIWARWVSQFHRKISKISLASGSGILTKEDEIECVCKEVRNAARKVGQKSVEEENEGTNFGNQHWSLNDFNIGPVISKGCSAVVYAANCLKNGFETIGNDSEGIKEISRVEKILKD